MKLYSLKPEAILTELDLDRHGLEAVKFASDRGNRLNALSQLRAYYRQKYPLSETSAEAKKRRFEVADRADQIVNHIFQWGPYEAADYGEDVNWEWDPRGDIEWVAAIYRFYWANSLADAFAATKDEKYAKAFVDLTSDWIRKHPLENHEKTHPVYTYWKGFAWLDIQTGIRATNICAVFKVFVHSESLTPEFLGVLLASLYEHQIKTEKIPMNLVHNKAIFEQRGFVNVAYTFQEFKDSRRWLKLALERTQKNLLAQTTSDGVQREWSGGYHLGVLRDAVEIMERMKVVGIAVDDDYKDRVRKMYDYIFAIATPELGFPMFGDCGRSLIELNKISVSERSRLPLYSTLLAASQLLGDVKYAALAKLDSKHLPQERSYAFLEAGMYVFRNDWGADQVYFALHCSPKAISGHDQPDNGTFELYAYGRWLMPDSGFYTYGHDPKGRSWHRRTRVHQTLTLNDMDSTENPKLWLWQTTSDFDAICLENQSYPDLLHRRSIWLLNKSSAEALLVLLDEAIGEAKGVISLHFQLAPETPGSASSHLVSHENKYASTAFNDANVLVWTEPKAPISMQEEEGWFAWEYGSRVPRKAFRYQHEKEAPAAFLTLIVPYKGTNPPTVSATLPKDFEVGGDEVNFQVEAFGKAWQIGRKLKQKEVWCKNISM